MTELATFDADAARALTERIKVAVGELGVLIMDAWRAKVWIPLGYAKWDDYCAAEFDGAHLRLPQAGRRELVVSMREIGMSTRAIASATGVSAMTVSNDLKPSGVQNFTPDAISDPEPDQREEEAPTVIGTDGKTYKAKPKRARSRPKLPSQFATASGDLSRLVARFERLATDDRYRPNRDVIAELCTPEIRRAVQVLDELLRDLALEENN